MRYFYLFFLLILFSCRKDKNEFKFLDNNLLNRGIFIVNEGNYTVGNSSLSFFDFQTREIKNDIYSKVNNLPLGDVAFSMKINKGLGYIVVNNSGKIVVIDIQTCRQVDVITGFVSPRYIEFYSDNKAFVSDLYSNYISVVKLSDYSINKQIYVGRTTEQIVSYKNYLYVINWCGGDKLFKIDAENDLVVDSLTLTFQPNSLVIDKNERLWVLSDGGFEGTSFTKQFPALTCVNLSSFLIEKIFFFSNKTSPTRLTINNSGDILYFINGGWGTLYSNSGVWRMNIEDEKLPDNAFILENGNLFYGLFVSADGIFVLDANDFIQPGRLLCYTETGDYMNQYIVGIIPGSACLK